MRMIKYMAVGALVALMASADICAQSAIYACGHIRRTRTEAYTNLRNSGFTTAILFNVTVEEDGTLTTDYDWANQRPAEFGGIICKDGEYVFDEYCPEYVDDVRSLLQQPTSINRLEICIGGWGNGSYGKIKKLIDRDGVGEESILYRNFKALKEVLPEIVAVNNDQEQDYDLAAATAFHQMMAEIGYKTTVAPYTNKKYWENLVANLNAEPGTVEIVYLQTYGGGAYNQPYQWQIFGDVPMYVGFDCEASANIGQMETNFTNWRETGYVSGGFLWNYNSEARNINQWATTINRIFPTMVVESAAATLFSESNFGGYSVKMPAGRFAQADMALYGMQAKDLASLEIPDGVTVTLYMGTDLSGEGKTFDATSADLGDWADKACSLEISGSEGGVAAVEESDGLKVIVQDGNLFVEGAEGLDIDIYNAAGMKVAGMNASEDNAVDVSGWSRGVYFVVAAQKRIKVII